MKETFLYFANAFAGDDDGGVYKASKFLGCAIVDADTIDLSFRSNINGATTAADDVIRFDYSTGFKEAMIALSSAMNATNGKMQVVADSAGSVYLYPFGGTVTVTQA
tara:strand:+ start:1645 stop:1965 length:321 start_codon:yes stop_codon:yes gene_type:complete